MAKIAIIHHSGIIGGAGVSLISMIKALAPVHKITVFVSDSPDDIWNQLKDLKVDLSYNIEIYGHRIGALTYYNGGDKLTSLRFLYRASLIIKQWHYWDNAIKRINPDIVITNSIILSWMSILPEIWKRKSICFVRETIHGTCNHIFNKIIRKMLIKYNKVAFLSEFDRSSWNYPTKKSVIIPDFVDDDALDNSIQRDVESAKFALDPNSFHVLYVGGVSFMKGFDIVVKAVLNLNETINTELIVAGVDFSDRKKMGGGKLSYYEEDIQAHIQKHKYGSKIHIIGRQLNMSSVYAVSDVLVFPMRSAHQARPIFEAGYYSIPAIISDFPHIRENLVDSVNGFVFKPGNISDLTEKLKLLAMNSELRHRLGYNNQNMTNRNHSKKSNSLAITNLISQTL